MPAGGGKRPRTGLVAGLGVDRPLDGAERTGLGCHRPVRRTAAAHAAERHHAAHGLAAVERALRAVRHLQAVAGADARAAEGERVVGVRVVEAQAVHQKQRLVRVAAAQEK